jgi:hypothetical protein
MHGCFTQHDLESLPANVLELMEEAACQFNRTAGALEAGASSPNIQRLRGKVLLAADEAMLDVLHQAALISKYPESASSIQSQLDSRVATLRELGERIEALARRDPTFTDMIARRTSADEVLEELRLEQAAFSELGAQETDSPRNHLQA